MPAKNTRSRLTLTQRELIKQQQATFIEKINTAIPNKHQAAIFEAAKSQQGRYVVLAGPGSGKTFTAIKASTTFTGSAIYFSYNKKIQLDTNFKLVAIDSNMTAVTAHSFGLSCLMAFNRGQCRVDDKETKYPTLIKQYLADYWDSFIVSISEEIEAEEADVNVMRLDAYSWSKTLIHYAQVSLSPLTYDALSSLVEEFDLQDIKPNSLVWPFVVQAVIYVIEEGKNQFLGPEHLLNYDDMIYYPNVLPGVPIRQYDHILVDEAQDTSKASLELMMQACHKDTQVFFIGDVKQCQPAGTMVRLQNGEDCPIESLNPGSRIVTFDRRSAAFVKSGVVTDIATRQYDGPLYTVTAGEKQSSCTDSHKWLVRWTNTDKLVWITYLMKKGGRYRVGQAQLFNTVEGRARFGLGTRARVERADAAWILQVHNSLESAITHEAITAAKYGLPQVVFNPVWNSAHLTQEAIDHIYDELSPLEEKAIQCLNDHGRKLEYPLYTRNGMNGYSDHRKVNSAGEQQRQGRTTLFETQTCNLIPEYMAIPLAPETISTTHDRLEWQPITITSKPYSGLVYSLNVEPYHKYIADSLVTCNSIYGFAGANFDSINQIIKRLDAEVLPLRICYRCGSTIVDLANQLGGQLISAGLHTGNVEVIPEYLDMLQPGDAVLSRTTANLIKGCLKTLQKGKRAKVLGRNLGENIGAIVTRLEARRISRGVPALLPNLANFLDVLEDYHQDERESLQESRKNPDLALSELDDKIETVKAFFEAYINKCNDESLRVEDDPKCNFEKTASDFKKYIYGLFSEDDNAKDFILYMTAHRSKGGEWERVFIINPKEFPHPKAKSDRQKQQENNLMYVAVTRAINNLYFVGEPFSCLSIPSYEPAEPVTIISFPAADHLEIHVGTEEVESVPTLDPQNVIDITTLRPIENIATGAPSTIEPTSIEAPAEGKVSRAVAIEVLCPSCNSACIDPSTGSLFITENMIGHSVTCSRCKKSCIVPLNAFSLQGEVIAREKPTTSVPNNQVEKRGRTKKERKSNAGRKAKSGTVRQPLQLSLDIRTINTLNTMGINKSELFEELLKQYEPFLTAWSELGNEIHDEDSDD